MISDALWRSQFNATPGVIGRAVTLNPRPFTIVGVMPRGFHFPVSVPPADIWITNAEDTRVDDPTDPPMTGKRSLSWAVLVGCAGARTVPGAYAALTLRST